ncbi:hypothetical protein [Microbacterium aurum]|uniref:hypothetical protein n=1 Tax=Microbacterium aurum TaxID=36805 RepID=UPI00248D3CCE|nr:hypothetical protein [Microbacterium aurum]MBZ6371208.1 hypothetical protein [Microbacterium hominis]
MCTITLTGGPLGGRTFDVPDRMDHHSAEGHYTPEGTLRADHPEALGQLASAKPLTDAELGESIGNLAESTDPGQALETSKSSSGP